MWMQERRKSLNRLGYFELSLSISKKIWLTKRLHPRGSGLEQWLLQ
jgi:hypothetical protein